MGKRRRKHKHKNKNKYQKQDCGHGNCDGRCKPKEPEAEVVEIETNAQLQELIDLIMEHGADRDERWQRSQKDLNNALLVDVGIPIPAEEPAEVEVADETSADAETAI